jgi:hypothetical protein
MTNIQEFEIVKETCGYCGKLISNPYTCHPACIKRNREEQSIIHAQKYGLQKQADPVEAFLKAHAHSPYVDRDGLTYNQRLAKQEQAKKEDERQEIVDRASRRRELSLLQGRLKVLKDAVARDEAEEKEETQQFGQVGQIGEVCKK